MKHDFSPYPHDIFIETGSYVGEGITAALKAGFKKVISIELSEYYYRICRDLFKDNPRVDLYFGDSVEVLPIILQSINVPCTFWLDGHFCGDLTACGSDPVPLMKEVHIIREHPIKTHTILIDDMRLLRDHDAEWKHLPYSLEDLERTIYSINKDYKITYDFGVVKNDILIAQV